MHTMKPTRATVALLTIVLALATALTLIGTAVTLADGPAVSKSSDGNLAVVRRFYAALNAAIATGDVSGLEAVVGAEFVGGQAGGQSGEHVSLAERLLVLHTARPDLWLRVEDAIADGDRVVARIAFEGLAEPSTGVAGLVAVPAADSPLWSAGERLRIADGRVVAYEGIVLALGTPRAVLDGVVAPPSGAQGTLGLARLTVPSGAQVFLTGVGGSVYAVEEGALEVQLAGEPRRLEAGDAISVPAREAFVVRSLGPDPATLLVVSLQSATMPWPPFSAEGDLRAVSLGEAAIVPSRVGLPGSARSSVLRVSLVAGRYALPLGAAGPSLVAVETGTALMTDAAGAPAMLAAGTAALQAPGATLDVQPAGDEPLTLLILTLSPA